MEGRQEMKEEEEEGKEEKRKEGPQAVGNSHSSTFSKPWCPTLSEQNSISKYIEFHDAQFSVDPYPWVSHDLMVAVLCPLSG